ncbi:MAG: endo alpha-1,4 polygalactosaminidase [Deltaproteobacteria bacterium]|nr:endo alpha-1,4 polygalactosaminidase [Deltaproteobacteria bacterium]MBW1871274.1 endo alpha-1,4 polygalactosaminidase [Deltaproteobacteria bacterium]
MMNNLKPSALLFFGLVLILSANCTTSSNQQHDGTDQEHFDAADAGWDSDDADPGEDDSGGDPGSAIWQPQPGISWQWQLSGTIDTSIEVAMYDIDLFDAPQAVIDELHAAGRIVICYFSAGSIEDWRIDAGDFPLAAIGNQLDNWPGENWIDIRDLTVRAIMTSRMDLALAKNCDGVEPDNVDGYTNNPGFDFDGSDQLDYNRFLASEAHARGLSIGLKNDLDQIVALVDDFDWALNEECFSYNECDDLLPFIEAGKAVFNVEYGAAGLADTICPQANALDFDSLIKNWDLDAWRVACR